MFTRNDRGNVTTIFALSAIPIMVAAGAAIDYVTALRGKSELQAAVDAAALSAITATGSTKQSAANKANTGNLTMGGCANTPVMTIVDQKVTASASCNVSTSLMRIAGIDDVTISAVATAVRKPGKGYCMITLHGTDKESVMINSDSAIIAPKCQLQINSSNSEALRGNSNGDITAENICLTGGYVNDSSSNFMPTPKKCTAVADPLASLPPPPQATASCTVNGDHKVVGTKTINPGVYCGKLEFDNGAGVTMSPGIYVVKGEFIVNSKSRLKGDDVMVYLMGNNNPRFNINSDSHIELRAPRTGTYAGIVFFQQRNGTADFSILNSDSTSFVEGVIYPPNTPLHLNSYGRLSPNTPWTMVITSKLSVNSFSVLRMNADYDESNVPLPAAVQAASTGGLVRLIK